MGEKEIASPCMFDYVKLTSGHLQSMYENNDIVKPLVNRYISWADSTGSKEIAFIASGSSLHACIMAKSHLERSLDVSVAVVTPEAFMDHEYHTLSKNFCIFVSQSGYSTNILSAIEFSKGIGMCTMALVGNPETPIGNICDHPYDWGVGVESIDFVTMGVESLINYLCMFGLEVAKRFGTVEQEALDSWNEGLASSIAAHSDVVAIADKFVADHLIELSRMAPIIVVGNGPALGVAREACLKFMETTKMPSMYFEGEEFLHGPEMQVVPGYRIYIIDSCGGSDRLAGVAASISKVTDSTYFITSHPRGLCQEIVLPEVDDPYAWAIPVLPVFQTIAACVSQWLDCWDVHPLLEAVSDTFHAKAAGYDDSVVELKKRASEIYSDCSA